ncbi:TonB family protein, partial [Chlorogloeopsis fritschii]
EPLPSAIASPTPKPLPSAIASPTPKPLPTNLASPTPEPLPTNLASPTPKPLPSAIASPTPKPQKIVVSPNTTPTQPKPTQTAIAPERSGQSGRLSGQTPSRIPGAASKLGGPLSVSRDNFKPDDLAALPNSNRSNEGSEGIDARRIDADINSYLEQMRQKVRQHWIPGLSQSSRRTVLNFTINRSGQVSNIQVAQTSGFDVTDEAALNAVRLAAPFAPLPTGLSSDYINIQFTFSINVYGELDLSGDGGY